jgi:hypothetical protein
MLKSLIGKVVQVVDDAGVETVLTLAFVAQFAAYSLPFHALDDIRVHRIAAESEVVEVVEVGTVVQMPARPKGRATRTVVVRESENARASAAPSTVPKVPRVQRPAPVEEALGAEELDELRAIESSVRVTVIGPDGQPRTKVVRLSGSRDGTTAPARRPHD